MKSKNLRWLGFLFLLFPLSFQVSGQEVNISIQVPDEAVAGESFAVTIHVNKGDLTGFARFQQNFPRAVNIRPLKVSNADFTFNDGKLNAIWLNLPAQADIVLKYEVTSAGNVKGDLVFEGTFSYLLQNDRAEEKMTPASVRITPSPKADMAQIVDIKDYTGQRPGTAKSETQYDVAAYREMPFAENNGWKVNLLISRGGLKKLARIEETIPAGYSVESIEKQNAIFSFKGGIAKFLWMSLPEDPYFIVSYKLLPQDGNLQNPPELTGIFAFMLNNDVRTIPVLQEKGAIHSMATPDVINLIGLYAMRRKEANTPQVPKPVLNEEPTRIAVETPAKTPEVSGIYFRVQLMATSRPVAIESKFAKYKMGKIYKENQNGLYKYTTGSFKNYADAREYIDQLAAATEFKQAFVTAYNNGKRISVREALNITRQEWFK